MIETKTFCSLLLAAAVVAAVAGVFRALGSKVGIDPVRHRGK